jgi:hypothetical protein
MTRASSELATTPREPFPPTGGRGSRFGGQGRGAQSRMRFDIEPVPRFLRISLYLVLLVPGVVSLFFLGRYGPLPTTGLLDLWLAAFLLHSFLRRKLHLGILFFGLVAYFVVFRVFPAIAVSAPTEDFLQAYRWLFYAIIAAIAVGRRWMPVRPLTRISTALVLLALMKAGLTFVVVGPGTRPGLFLENNFELALFSGLLITCYPHLGRFRGLLVLALGLLTVLAGSRSGSILFVIVVVFVITQSTKLNLLARYLLLLTVPIAGLVASAVFDARAAPSGSIDRLNFLGVFEGEVANWDFLDWTVGTWPITPLSSGGCRRLSYYENLFSSVGDGTCYSVIFHAFLMRVVFDAGILGLVLSFGVLLYTMRRAQVTWPVTLALLSIAIANSFSVSGPNSPYVVLPILLAIMTSRAATRSSNQSGADQDPGNGPNPFSNSGVLASSRTSIHNPIRGASWR